ncbi:hypothetical protein J2T57_001351 [Natronocella acetinitrilica]|uniref:Uncharacterized protein n=1 Tax=Natronocella acetinitrilica TaxID=414046 RepID=A0AAE3G396_9GAMM|nr:hypothetical protein [Natronocella acetinitrilica]MCP1674249.1 hypothetical protein [Natronocella acetinitrilica]
MQAMNTRLTGAAAALALALSLGVSAPAKAQFMNIDYANLAENIVGNMQSMNFWAQEKMVLMESMSLNTALSDLTIQNQNNATANTIIRINQRATDLHNTRAITRSIPAYDVCDNVSIVVSMEDAVCAAVERKDDDQQRIVEKHTNFSQSAGEFERSRREAAAELVGACDELGFDRCADASMLLGGSGDGLNISDRDGSAEATFRQIDIITGGLPERKTSPSLGAGVAANEQRINDLRREALRSLVTTSLSEIRAARLSIDDMPSEFQNMWEFSAQRWGTEEAEDFLKRIANAHPDKAELGNRARTYPEEVIRLTASMQAFQTFMAVESYRQSLRLEALNAGMLSLMIQPLLEQ